MTINPFGLEEEAQAVRDAATTTTTATAPPVVEATTDPWTADQILKAQNRLTKLGLYTGEINGVMDRKTRRALKAFASGQELDWTEAQTLLKALRAEVNPDPGDQTKPTPPGGKDDPDPTDPDDPTETAPPPEINLEGASLIRVKNTDSGFTYFAEYQVYGVTFRYEIGDAKRLADLGLTAEDFGSYEQITFNQFNNREGLDVGLIDERFGVTETPQESIRRQLRVFGKEDLPPWMTASKEAMTIALQGALEGWSDGRILNDLSRTAAFKQAFPEFDSFRSQRPDATITQTLADYTAAREQIRDSIQTWRGPQADLSDQFIGQVLAQGWDPTQVETVLIGEAKLRSLGPGAVDRLNEILAYQGHAPITLENLLDMILPGETQRTPFGLQELVNDAIRSQAFATQGITLSGELASLLGPDLELGVLDPEAAAQIARETATQIFKFGHELSAEREGLTRDDLIKAMVNGDQAAEVSLKLAKFARRRQIESQGIEGRQGFLGERGNLRIAGFDSL